MLGCARPLALTLLLAAAACGSKSTRSGSSNDPNPVATPAMPTAVGTPIGETATKTIGPGGGALTSAHGDLSIVVPRGAVAADTEFSIQPLVNMAPGGVGRVFRIRPEGVTLMNPVTLTFKAADPYAPGTSIGDLGISYQDASGYWHPAQITRDASANTISTSATHFSDWGVAWVGGTPVLQGSFTLNQTYDAPISATGTASLYLQSDNVDNTVYVLTGNITVPSSIQIGTATCTTSTPTITMPMSTAEVVKSTLKFRWGLNGGWGLACTDNSTGASFSRLINTAFDTMQINLVKCPGSYVGTQTVGPGELAGSFTSDCGAQGQVTATWDFISCAAGATCQSANACQTATITCPSGPGGAPVCTDSGNLSDGTVCGANEVCSAGACVACTPAVACTPTNPCDAGTLSCTAGPVCTDTGTPLANGASCGTNMVCATGACVACTPAAACTPANPCDAGTLSCTAGPVCTDTGTPLANGASCGTNQVCATGACVACTPGAACTPANPCLTPGTLDCSAGPVCVGTPVANGTICGTGQVCEAGACGACIQGAPCATNPCVTSGTLDCSAGPVCTGTPVANGTACGTPGQICTAGVCGP